MSMKPDWDEDGGMGPDVYDCDGGVFAVVDDEPETIARPFCEADAHLIASAPEMLEALERILVEGLTEETRAVAVAALKKARGPA